MCCLHNITGNSIYITFDTIALMAHNVLQPKLASFRQVRISNFIGTLPVISVAFYVIIANMMIVTMRIFISMLSSLFNNY